MMIRTQVLIVSVVLLLPLGGCAFGPMTTAVRHGDAKALAELLEQGADVEEKSPGDMTPLHVAAGEDRVDIVRILLDKGARIDAQDFNGWTPLHYAVTRGRSEIVRLLLERGASVRVKGLYGGTPLELAERARRPNLPIVQMLMNAEAKEMAAQPKAEAASQVAAVPPVSAPVPAAPVIASDVDRVPAGKATVKKHAYAVVIGIEQYREQLPKANFAAHDASVVGDYLTKALGYPEENVVVRLNEKATKTDLEKYFEGWLPNNVEKDSSVFVYFSGHGAPHVKTGDAYMVPYDGDPTFVDKTGFSLKRLYAALDKLPARDVTVVLDSCFSGAGGRSVLAEGARPMVLSIENPVLASGKVTVLAASSGDQISNTFKEQGHGLLTYFFLRGLQGEGDSNKDGSIEMVELLDYVKPNVQRVARKQYNNEQTPQLLASPDVLKQGGGRLLERTRP